MSTWYKISTYLETIEPVEVERETKKKIFIVYKDWHDKPYTCVRVKISGNDRFFSTWIEAYDELRIRVELGVQYATSALEQAHRDLDKVMKMTPPC